MVELAGLLPLETVVLLLSGVVDEVTDDEGRQHRKDGGPDNSVNITPWFLFEK